MLLGTKQPSVELGILDQVLYAVRVDYVHVFNKDIPNPERIIPSLLLILVLYFAPAISSRVFCQAHPAPALYSPPSCPSLARSDTFALAG